MTCERCHGVMTTELLYDFLENDAQIYVADGDGFRDATRAAMLPAG
jgi:hypothetical protein